MTIENNDSSQVATMTKHIGLRIKSDLYEKLKVLAKANDRTINGQIRYLIQMAVLEWEGTEDEVQNDQGYDDHEEY